jgi:hypothetical protein
VRRRSLLARIVPVKATFAMIDRTGCNKTVDNRPRGEHQQIRLNCMNSSATPAISLIGLPAEMWNRLCSSPAR